MKKGINSQGGNEEERKKKNKKKHTSFSPPLLSHALSSALCRTFCKNKRRRSSLRLDEKEGWFMGREGRELNFRNLFWSCWACCPSVVSACPF